MRRPRIRGYGWALPLALATAVLLEGGAAIRADSVLLRSGAVLDGALAATWTLQTADGEVEIPRTSLRALTLQGGAAEVTLRDGTNLTGRLLSETIELRQPLLVRRFPVADVRELLFSDEGAAAPGAAPAAAAPLSGGPASASGSVRLPAGAPLELELARALSSKGPETVATVVPLCVVRDLAIDGGIVIPAGRVALAELAVVDPAGAANRVGRLVLEPRRTWTGLGDEVPLRGQVTFEGAFNAGDVVALGAVGLLAKGGEASARTGTRVDASVARDLELPLGRSGGVGGRAGTPPPWPREHQERCDQLRRFREPEGFLRVSDVPKDLELAPLRSPMRLELPVPTLARLRKGEAWQAYLVRRFACEDVRLASLEVGRVGGPKGKAVFAVKTLVQVDPSYDRWVDLRFELVAEGRVLAAGSVGHVDAEEGKVVPVSVRLVADEAALAASRASEPPALRVTLVVTNNG